MTRFEFSTAGRILFGPGTSRELGHLTRGQGRRALVVVGRDAARAEPVVESLKAAGVESVTFSVATEPDVACVQSGTELAREKGVEVVVAIGGGSVMDAGKGIAALLGNGGEVLDYLEVIGRGQPLQQPSKPFIAVPTTSGTGSEVTRNAVLASPAHRVKASLRGPFLLPSVAVIDPELVRGLPAGITAFSGMDAVTQLIEAFVCVRANPMTDALCLDGLARAARALPVAVSSPSDLGARSDMAYAAMLSGVALSNAGLGAVHGFAGPLGGMFEAPHGALCAALLPHVMETNIAALRREKEQPSAGERLGRYRKLASLFTGKREADPEEGAQWVSELVRRLRIPTLSAYGMTPEHTAEAVDKASKANSMKANPVPLSESELAGIFRAAL